MAGAETGARTLSAQGRPSASEFVFARLRYDSGAWESDYDWRNKRFQREDNTKFAVNLVLYAMTA